MKEEVWIWEDVLCDYTCGMAVVKAETKEEAYKKVRNDDDMIGFYKKELLNKEPRKLKDDEIAWVHGGS